MLFCRGLTCSNLPYGYEYIGGGAQALEGHNQEGKDGAGDKEPRAFSGTALRPRSAAPK
jgi:hypothetical protein